MVRIQKISLLFVLLLVTAFVHAQIKIGNVYYKIIENTQTVKVCAGQEAYTGAIEIPGTIKFTENGSDYQVVAIEESAFKDATGLTSISIPANVKTIGTDAFKECTNLTKAIFASVNDLCAITFANASANPMSNSKAQLFKNSEEPITTINEPISQINAYAFYGCSEIRNVWIPENITSIGEDAFYGTNLDKVYYANMTHLTTMSYGNTESNPIYHAKAVWVNNKEITEVTITNNVKNYAFKGFKNLTKVKFQGDNVNEIGIDAFFGCTGLSKITLPSSLATIGQGAFRGSNLESITIPENVTNVAVETFYECKALESVTILTSSLISLPRQMFYGCTKLKEVSLPSATKTIGVKVFMNCSSLTSLPVGNLETFDQSAFENCNGFTEITLPKTIQTINNYAFKNCTNLTDLFIPAEATSLTIGSTDYVFSGSESLRIYSNTPTAPSSSVNPFNGYTSIKVYIPSGTTSGYNQSPWTLDGLTLTTYQSFKINYYVDYVDNGVNVPFKSYDDVEVGQPVPTPSPNEQPTKSGWVFAGWDDEIPSLMPDQDVNIKGHFTREYISTGEDDFGVKYFLRSDTRKAKVTGYENPANPGNVKINPTIDLDEVSYTIDSIGANAFNGKNLKEINLSDATTNIGISLFEGCTALENVTLPSALTEIKEKMFYGCTALSTLVLPNNPNNEETITIGASAFAGCTALSTLVLPDNVVTIGASAFEGCTNYNIDHLPLGLQTLGKAAFKSSGIVNMTLPSSIETMGENVFQSCINLKNVVFDEEMSLTVLPAYTFSGCSNLESFTLPASIETIGEYAFNNCSGLKLVELNNIEVIRSNAFSYCNNLKAITLPTINTLGNRAFSFCKNVEMITIESTNLPSVGENTFSDDVYSKATLCVKNADNYKNHDIWQNFLKIETIASSSKLIYKLDGIVLDQVPFKPGTAVEPHPAPNADKNPKGRAFSGWKDEPKIMPNKDSVIVGSLKYQRTYKAEGTTDVLYSDSLFYGYEVSHPDNDLKKDRLSYVIIKPFETMPAKDSVLYVSYSLTTAPTGKDNTFNNDDQDLINYVNLKEGSGTLKYSLDKKIYSTEIKGKDAKTYKVYYRVDGVTEHYNTEPDSLEVAIAPRTVNKLTIKLKENENGYTYDGKEKKPEVESVSTKINSTETLIPKNEYKVSYGNNINATTKESKAQVIIKDSIGGNYIIEDASTTFEIKQAKGKLADLLTKTGKPTAEDNLSYTGEAKKLIKAGTIKEGISGSLKYSLDNKTFDTAIPQGTDAKEYTVYYKVEDDPNYTPSDTASLKVTIKAKEIALSAESITLEKDSYTYDGTAKKPGVTVKTGETIIPAEEYTVSYQDSINAGTAKVIITDKEGGNYKFESAVNKTFTIIKAAGLLSELLATNPQPAGDNILYNTASQNLIKAGTLNKGMSGTLKYSLDKITFNTTIPQGTDAKEYTVYYMVADAPNYNPSDTLSLKVTILPRTTSVTNITLKEDSYTYDGTAKTPAVESVSVSFNNLVIDTKEFKVSYANNVNATTKDSKAQVLITDSLGGNFIVEDASKTFEIKPAKGALKNLLTQEPTAIDNLSYTGEAQNLIKAGTIKNGISGTLKYSLDNKEFVTTIPQGKEAQDYTIYYKVEDDPNYAPSDTASLKVAINAKKLSLSADNITLEKDSYTYDGTAKKPGVTVKTGGTTIPAEEYTVSYKDNVYAGTATVTVTEQKGSNYSFGSVSKTFKITPAASSLTQNPTGKNLTYDGTAQELINKDGKTSTGTLEYSLSQDEATFKSTIPTGTDAKTYTVYYRVKGDDNHSDSEIGSVKVTIAPREVNAISLSKSSYTYSGVEIKADVTVTWNKITVPGSEYTVSYSNNKNVGTATVTVKDKEGGNFTVSGSKTFTIAKAPLTISANSYEIFEGDKIPEFTVKYDGFVNKETEAVLTAKPILSCNATASSKPGDYTISVGGSKAANYNITHKSGKLTIIAMKFVSGGESSKDEDDSATYQIISTGNDTGKTPTVAITDDKEVGGAFAIPETVTYHNKTFTVTEIGESTFENNTYLTNVTIPSSITSIGDKAFKGCSNLKSITVYITTPISLAVATTRGDETSSDGTSIFEGVDKLTCVLYVPDGSVDLYKEAPVWSDFKHIVPISTLTGISGVNVTEGEPFDVYNLQGRKVKSRATDLRGLPRGIYIINGKKVAVK